MKQRYLWLAAVALLVGMRAQAEVKVGSWSALYDGVDQTTATIDGRDASVVYAMRIDLKAPGIDFVSSPQAGSKDAVSETTKDFAQERHLQLAINAGFFAPCCSDKKEDKDIFGLAISAGKVVSPPSKDGTYDDVLMITKNNEATIGVVSAGTDLSKVFTAVTGSAIIVQNGANTGDVNNLNKADYGNPRTVVGLSRDRRYLYMVVIDGRRPSYSVGVTNAESARIMIALGAYTALNLDGGGSTTMVREDEKSHMITVNRPSGGAAQHASIARLVAISLGVHAQGLSR